MAKHTPGPWRIEAPSPGSKFPIIQGKDWSGEVATIHGDTGEEEIQANAHLIAAAPDLLVACQLLIEAYKQGEDNGGSMDWSDVDQVYETATEAVAKAIPP